MTLRALSADKSAGFILPLSGFALAADVRSERDSGWTERYLSFDFRRCRYKFLNF
jgi:hypothetical protein